MQQRKKIVKDAFRTHLPDELYSRNKQGFEVPLLTWFRTELKSTIDELLDENYLEAQKLINPAEVIRLKLKLASSDPGDSVARIWALIVFQNWYKKYIKS